MNELYQSKDVYTMIYTTLYGEFSTAAELPIKFKRNNTTISILVPGFRWFPDH